ncbi:4Fe-4S dicluster domain protein [Clostridium puniceum]|uniref:4Fe-4S dicluster domain protein n=1 Tax=Clostridium puniceum TaxID=29367 RepID=A0A1S8T837_9CLOT|nr:EFR1 family ferrodoxin [Clostridium puniceum]OOM73822.1 4Fe-4S dicluster domain protein [Clostridium puniceum]
MATIFCFSTTGNCLYASNQIALKINATVISMTESVQSCDDDVIGFVFPTYFWGLPKIVERFISNIKITNKNSYIFAITTYGNKNKNAGNSIKGVIGAVDKLLSKKGLAITYGNVLHSVQNFIVHHEVIDSEEIQKNIDENLKILTHDIAEKKQNEIKRFGFINKLIYSSFPHKNGHCDNHFNISPNCTGCGICKSICPMQNILLKEGKPTYLHNCELCLACLHACPTTAIEWKKSTIGKKRYRNPHISLKELIVFNSSK